LLFAITITGEHSKTAPAGIYNFISYREILWGPLAASSMIVLLPVLVFFWFAQDKLIRGMTFGAIK
jgi:ABC-type glycerol-3-phosphate transport system permease component